MNETKSTLHARCSAFVDWIRPDKEREKEIRAQAHRIRERIRGRAQLDGLCVKSTPEAGSFAKNTGLRRHLPGGSVVEGYDVDLPFVVLPADTEGELLDDLLGRFERYAKEAYPQNSRNRTKSSVALSFTNTKESYDLVPMLATSDDQTQVLIRATGERIETSVQKHVELIRSRTRSSNESKGRVKFNECVRFMKWWKEFVNAASTLNIPSITVDLLCAKAFDEIGVETTYHRTLARWFDWMAHQATERNRIAFTDFTRPGSVDSGAPWEVLDPVNPKNNVVSKWRGIEIDDLAERFEKGRDCWNRAIRADRSGDDSASMRYMIELFGTPFKHHSGGK